MSHSHIPIHDSFPQHRPHLPGNIILEWAVKRRTCWCIYSIVFFTLSATPGPSYMITHQWAKLGSNKQSSYVDEWNWLWTNGQVTSIWKSVKFDCAKISTILSFSFTLLMMHTVCGFLCSAFGMFTWHTRCNWYSSSNFSRLWEKPGVVIEPNVHEVFHFVSQISSLET